MPPSFCPRKRIGTPPSTATRSMLRSPGRSVTIASTNLVGMPIKAAVCAFPMAVVTEAGDPLFPRAPRKGERPAEPTANRPQHPLSLAEWRDATTAHFTAPPVTTTLLNLIISHSSHRTHEQHPHTYIYNT